MEGAALAAKRKADADMFAAYSLAAFVGAAVNGHLGKMKKFLPSAPKRAQSPNEMIAALREFQARGANMNIRRVN